ncbi:MAG: hypothetical protein HKN92_09725 [Chitinophagales bacterium]|nr:hypothetical protein [Chitinophagales bacterium]
MLETVGNENVKTSPKVIKLIPDLRKMEEEMPQLHIVRDDFDENVNSKGVFYLPVTKKNFQHS